MITFLDGPAAGVKLDLRRAPVFLRVTRDESGKWDALDQFDDEPRRGESITVYRLVSQPITMHISCHPRSMSRWIVKADYQLLHFQPEDHEVRSTTQWRAWCQKHGPLLVKFREPEMVGPQ